MGFGRAFGLLGAAARKENAPQLPPVKGDQDGTQKGAQASFSCLLACM